MLAPAIHRVGEGFVPMAGGDKIGAAPLNFHVEALKAMGAEVEQTDEGIWARATKLCGTQIRLDFPSVMATESVMLAAVKAEGRTLIDNAATEPEVVELASVLATHGSAYRIRPDRRIIIEGVETLTNAVTHLSGDRIEAFSYLLPA